MGRPREFDPEKALDAAMRVFWSKGYHGASVRDLTNAMGITGPSLYAAYGNKEDLFRKALQRYVDGPSNYVNSSLNEPTARASIQRLFHGVIDMLTDPANPGSCLFVQGVHSCGEKGDPLRDEMACMRAVGITNLRKRLERAVKEGDLAADTDVGALAHYVATVSTGLSVQAATGATREELQNAAALAMQIVR